jgi:hypothetical protein
MRCGDPAVKNHVVPSSTTYFSRQVGKQEFTSAPNVTWKNNNLRPAYVTQNLISARCPLQRRSGAVSIYTYTVFTALLHHIMRYIVSDHRLVKEIIILSQQVTRPSYAQFRFH